MEKNSKVLKIGRDVQHTMLNNIVKPPENPSGAFAAILKIKRTQLVIRIYLAYYPSYDSTTNVKFTTNKLRAHIFVGSILPAVFYVFSDAFPVQWRLKRVCVIF